MSQLKLPSLAQAADQIGSTGIARLGLGALGIAGVAAAFYFSVYLKLPTFKLAKEPGGRVVPDESEYSKKEQQLTKDLIKADEVATDFSDIGGLRQQVSRDPCSSVFSETGSLCYRSPHFHAPHHRRLKRSKSS